MIIFYIFYIFCNVLFAYSDKISPLQNLRDEAPKSIIDDSTCSEVRTICQNIGLNDDVLIIECLLSTNPERLNRINKDCQNVIWDHIRKLIEDKNVKKILSPTCGSELDQLNCRADNKGNFLKCVINNIKEIKKTECSQALLRLESVAFTDYHWISSFLEHCTDDIRTLRCGRFESQSFSQLETVSCLQAHILGVQDYCKREVFRLSEVQSNNIKLDAELYRDCAEDQMRYCSQIPAGTGRIFPCLMHNMNLYPTKITAKCQQKLIHRQKLIVQDYRVSKGLLRACKEDIKRTHCRKQISSDKTVRLAQILLCLEKVIKNGTRVDGGCEAEMIDHRRMLMEDYRLSPEIVNDCKNETTIFCKGYEQGGKTIHCLMSFALNRANSITARLGDTCLRALEDLVHQTDVGENWSVDPVLQQACSSVVQVACRGIRGGDSRIVSCLMDNIRSDQMTEDCENALIEIQYFVARDFKLDPQLYRACKLDASRYCHSFESREGEQGPSYGPQILSCLYRQAYQENSHIQKGCHQQIQRVMRQRAISVDLHPEIEEACVRDLGAYCQDKSKKGEEIQCLQDNLDDLDDDCHKAVESYTEIEAEDIKLNPFIMKYCEKIIETLCNSNSNNGNGYVMDCLIENKNNMVVKTDPSCRASIEHFQIISLKDYRFTYKFKIACKSHAMRLCGQASSKSDVIACLSEHILNATVQGLKSTIPKECRQQLKSQIFQQREKIDYNPVLKKLCTQDIKNFCANVPSGNSQVLECLQTVPHGQLSNKCSKEVFKVQKLEIYDNSVDYALITMCAETIDQFCPHHEKETIFNCLKINKDEKGFSKKCRMIVMHRLAEQNSNNLLNPSLQHNCQLDIAKSCKQVLMTNVEEGVEDSVIKCLKMQFKLAKLTDSCEKEIADILREQALDVRLNPLIRVVCKNELETICKFEGEDSGNVEECLKSNFVNKNIPTPECRLEVANMIEESQADIQVDPLLQRSCALDLLTYCGNIEQGNGRHIQCLKTVMSSPTHILSPNCRKKLKERLEMYKNAAKLIAPADFHDLYKEVNDSPSRYYFFIVILTIFGTIFFFGVFCGRISRTNRYTLLKNK